MVPLVNSVAEAREAVAYCRFPPQGCRSLVAPSRALLTQEGFGGPALSRYLESANSRVQVWLQVESGQCLEALDDILASVPGIDCMFLGPADMAVSLGLVATAPTGNAPQQQQPQQPSQQQQQPQQQPQQLQQQQQGGAGSASVAAGPAAGPAVGAAGGAAAGGAGGGGSPPRDLAAVLAGPEMAAVHERVLQSCRRHGVAAGSFCLGPAAARQLAAMGYSVVGFDVDLSLLITGAAAAMAQLRRA